METYELTVVLPGKVTPAKKKEALKTIESLVKVSKGSVKNQKEWGTLDLSYPIQKNTVGTYLHFTLELPKSSVKNIDEKMRVDENVIRYLLVRAK